MIGVNPKSWFETNRKFFTGSFHIILQTASEYGCAQQKSWGLARVGPDSRINLKSDEKNQSIADVDFLYF